MSIDDRYPPCDCGNETVSWHGDRYSSRTLCCEQCWAILNALHLLQSDYVQRNLDKLGVLGKKDVEEAIGYLKEVKPPYSL